MRTLKKQSLLSYSNSLHLSRKTAELPESSQLTERQADACSSGSYFAHLELEEAPLLLHLFCDLGSRDLRADHAVLLRVLSLLLLDFCTVIKADAVI